jgi:hypothetical protein
MPLHIINGDIFNMDNVEYIVHQVNCLTVQSHGLSESISIKYQMCTLREGMDDIYHSIDTESNKIRDITHS